MLKVVDTEEVANLRDIIRRRNIQIREMRRNDRALYDALKRMDILKDLPVDAIEFLTRQANARD